MLPSIRHMNMPFRKFILLVTFLVVVGTILFAVSLSKEETQEMSLISAGKPQQSAKFSLQRRAEVESWDSLNAKAPRRVAMDRSNYRVTNETAAHSPALREQAERVERESHTELEKMTNRYRLTHTQQEELFPILARHHTSFQKGMRVNGQLVSSSVAGVQVSSEIYPHLDPIQQELYQNDLLARDEWWGEIIDQLQEDLDQAIVSGEMVMTHVDQHEEERSHSVIADPGEIIDENAGKDEGAVIENGKGGISLDNLLGQ